MYKMLVHTVNKLNPVSIIWIGLQHSRVVYNHTEDLHFLSFVRSISDKGEVVIRMAAPIRLTVT